MRLLVLTAAVLTAGSASTAGQAVSAPPRATFKSGVEAVTVGVAVRDRRGRVIRGLTRSDFQVFDSGERREIKDFYTGDSPVSLAVLLDISGSMSVGSNMDRARHAVAVAMKTLRQGSDEAALYTFDSALQEVVRFTTDLDRVHRVSLEGKPWGTTLLYDAIAQAAREAAVRGNRHRALLVVTDGVDSGSRLTAAEVSGVASGIDVPVYLLTVASPLDHVGVASSVTGADAASRVATLGDLARWTGGDARIASQPGHTTEAIRDLFTELRLQYLITFEPGARPGWHPLEIRTGRKNLSVRARGGYMGGPVSDNGRSSF